MSAFDCKFSAELNSSFGMKEWIEATIRTSAREYSFRSYDLDVVSGGSSPIPVNVEVSEHGVRIESQGHEGRQLEVVLSPSLLAEIIEATCHLAARAGSDFPHVTMARALMSGGTSIVNRPRGEPRA
jgi:hypothetical protein